MSFAGKWFVSNDEFRASTEDYAVVGEDAVYYKNHYIDEPSNPDLGGISPADPMFVDLSDNPMIIDLIDHPDIYDPRLVYADVNRDDEAHQKIYEDVVKAGFMEEGSEKIKEIVDKLKKLRISHQGCCAGHHEDEEDAPDDQDDVQLPVRTMKHQGALGRTQSMIDDVLKLEDEEERRLALLFMSRQSRRKMTRPVMLLIGMIDKFSEGVKEGWLVGYDFYTENIIIKPYHAIDGTQHPLAEKWDIELPDDGVSWKGHPADFVANKLLPLQEQIDKPKAEKPEEEIKDDTYGFKLLAYHSLIKWMQYHFDALADINQADGTTLLKDIGFRKINEIYDSVFDEMFHIPFVHKRQDKKEAMAGSMPTLKYMQDLLEEYEYDVRLDALDAKKAGKEEVAQNVAKLYGQLLEQLRSFNLDPEKPL
ncbi:MAG: hypothetical protein Q9168_004851 [Polycauliona sp. 1 TL-2023]